MSAQEVLQRPGEILTDESGDLSDARVRFRDEIPVAHAHLKAGPPEPARARGALVHRQSFGHELELPAALAQPRAELDVLVVREQIRPENRASDCRVLKCERPEERG